MKSTFVDITPEKAAELLKGNTNNRHLSKSRVADLAAQMKNDKWLCNGDTIRVSTTGRLLDGQHRLSAIIESKTTQKMLLVTGLPETVFTTIDVGAVRRSGDFLQIDGFSNTNALAAAALTMICYERSGNPFNDKPNGVRVSKTDIVEYCQNHPEIVENTDYVANRRKLNKVFSGSALAMALTIFSQQNRKKALEFLEELETGYYSYPNSPVAALRDRLMLSKVASRTEKKYCTALLFKAWALYKKGASSKVLKLNLDDTTWFKET